MSTSDKANPAADKSNDPIGEGHLVVGASRGIGFSLVEHALALPSSPLVVAMARRATDSKALAELQAKHPRKLLLVDVDVTKPASVQQAADALGPMRIARLVNATGLLHDKDAGIHPEKRWEDIDIKTLEEVMRVNAFGTALLLQAFVPKMVKDRPCVFGAISARVGSIEDNRIGGWYAYRASKAALNQIIKTASIEAKRRYPSVIMAALHPGTTDTDLSRPFQARVPPEKLFSAPDVAKALTEVMDGLQPEDSGGFFAWDGQAIPY